MKEVRYWEAEDGTPFESEYDCQDYERQVKFARLLETVPCYNKISVRMTGEEEGVDEGDICYILIPDEIDARYDEALAKLDEEFFTGLLPYNEAKPRNDLLYWDENSYSWRVWSRDHENLELLGKHFQLFEGE